MLNIFISYQQCLPNHFTSANNCFPCSIGSRLDTATNKCICQIADTTFVGSKCVCNKANMQIVSGACTCPVNYFADQVGNCVICPNTISYRLSSTANNTCQCRNTQLIFSAIDKECKCPVLMINIGGVCVLCPDGGYRITDTQCSCPTGQIYNRTNNKCECASISDRKQGDQCITCPGVNALYNTCNCQAHSQYNHLTNLCECEDNYYYNGVNCVACSTSGIYASFRNASDPDSPVNQCICINQNQIWNGGACECLNNYVVINNVCTRCPPQSTSSNKVDYCQCPGDYRYNYNANNINSNQCLCKENFAYHNGSCQQCPTGSTKTGINMNNCVCPAGTTYNVTGNLCSCADNQINISNVCKGCPQNSSRNRTQDRCICRIEYNLIYDDGENTCRCKENYYLNNTNFLCIKCEQNSIRLYSDDNKSCTCLTQNAVFDRLLNYCKCQPGYYLKEQLCLKCDANTIATGEESCGCGAGEQFYDGTCICKENYILRTVGTVQQCVACPIGSTKSLFESTCKCTQQIKIYNQIKNTCDCVDDYYMKNGECYKCPQNAYRLQGQTQCQCAIQNQIYNAGTNKCGCQTPNFEIGNMCAACPPNAVYNATANLCFCYLQNQIYIKTVNQCQCKENFSINAAGNCAKCPSNSYRLSNHQACICQNQNTFYNQSSQNCDCLVNYYLFNKVCVQCGPGAFRNAGQLTCQCNSVAAVFDTTANTCKCRGNSFKMGGSCFDCGVEAFANSDQSSCICTDILKVFSLLQQKCICAENYYFFGQCIKCAWGQSVSDGQSCECPFEKMRFDPALNKCLCTQNYYQTANICTPCPSNSHRDLDQESCVCDPPLSFVNGICQCSENSVLVKNICELCPKDSVVKDDQCFCVKMNYVYDSTQKKCVCDEYSILDPEKGCKKCPFKTKAIQNKCDCTRQNATSAIYDSKQNQCICSNQEFNYSENFFCNVSYDQSFKTSGSVAGGSAAGVFAIGVVIGIISFLVYKNHCIKKTYRIENKNVEEEVTAQKREDDDVEFNTRRILRDTDVDDIIEFK